MSKYVENEKKRMKREYGYDYMDPLSDTVFKSIFILDKNYTIIRILVKELLGIDFQSIKVRHPGFIAKGKNKKGEESDYYIEIDNKKITIECNRKYAYDLLDRNKSHLRRMIVDSDDFEVVQINYDNYDILKKNKPVYRFSIKEETYDSDLYKQLIQIFHINLSYFAKILKEGYNKDRKFSLFEKMCLIFKTRTKQTLEEIVKGDEELNKLRKAIEDINNNEGAWKKYSKAEIELAIEAREAREKGLQEGREEGIKEGIKEGEKNKQIEIAKNMLLKDMDISIISELTGLSKEEINCI